MRQLSQHIWIAFSKKTKTCENTVYSDALTRITS